jgi:hypothetical protein
MKLAVSPNRRRLIREDGSPFFYLGDTAWNLFHFLDREECDFYLRTRAAQGFTVIQAVAVAEQGPPDMPNRYGEAALPEGDPLRPNPRFFAHVDWVVRRAGELGLVMALLPTWGDKWNKGWGIGPEIFTPENARAYGKFLGRRYHDASVIWVVGGDRTIDRPEHLLLNRALAEGLREGDDGRHLITFHPNGGYSSGQAVHDEAWLDFNMQQSGHDWPGRNVGAGIREDWNRLPVKPVLDGEPRYEDHPIMGGEWEAPFHGYFEPQHIRQAAYAAVLNGACGHTYGCHGVWQFFGAPGRSAINGARTPWREALFLPAASQMRFLREMMESLDWMNLRPAPEMVCSCDTRLEAGATEKTAVVYFPRRVTAALSLRLLAGENLAGRWIAPQDGRTAAAWDFPKPRWTRGAGEARMLFVPPREGDWVLRIDVAP